MLLKHISALALMQGLVTISKHLYRLLEVLLIYLYT